MQKESIKIAAQTLKEHLATQTIAPNGLFMFAKNYAVSRGLINEASVKQLQYFSTSDSERAILNNTISDLIDRITADHEQYVGSGIELQEEKRRALARKVAERLQPEKEVVVELKGLTKKYKGGSFHLAPLDLLNLIWENYWYYWRKCNRKIYTD
ncbi:MAG: hypothetical protein IPK76_03010 [Lewinellaceae bacterium]|nr:hypothetical protein [Lewinellaceae bacterium]